MTSLDDLLGPPPDPSRLPDRPLWWQPGMPQPLVDLLARFSYKPGWRFWLQRRRDDQGYPSPFMWELAIEIADVLDAYGSGRVSTFQQRCPVVDEMEPGEFTRWLWHQVLSMEQHEAGEWFVVAGERPYDPHAR
jgi:hypothetical protein